MSNTKHLPVSILITMDTREQLRESKVVIDRSVCSGCIYHRPDSKWGCTEPEWVKSWENDSPVQTCLDGSKYTTSR